MNEGKDRRGTERERERERERDKMKRKFDKSDIKSWEIERGRQRGSRGAQAREAGETESIS
jgi:hypothetical protein